MAAGAVFVLRGYHGATMDEVAHRAGLSKPMLYQHFSGKLEMYLAVLHDHVDMLVTGVRDAVRLTADNRERVHAAVRAHFDFVDHETQGYRLVFGSDAMSEPTVQRLVEGAFDACVDVVFALVAQDSALAPHRARMLAVGLVGLTQFSARDWLESNRPVPKEEVVAGIGDLCWRGLSHVPLRPSGARPGEMPR